MGCLDWLNNLVGRKRRRSFTSSELRVLVSLLGAAKAAERREEVLLPSTDIESEEYIRSIWDGTAFVMTSDGHCSIHTLEKLADGSTVIKQKGKIVGVFDDPPVTKSAGAEKTVRKLRIRKN